MRRADRLLQIMLLLRGRRCTTATQLAEWLEVSERTVYRDIRDLIATGTPIDGEAGVGYRLRKGFELPPLLFNKAEVQALQLGARMVFSWADAGSRQAAQSALTKLEAALPPAVAATLQEQPLYVPSHHPYPVDLLGPLRDAIMTRHKLQMDYVREDGYASQQRLVWPLGLFFWGDRWTLVAWCEQRSDFRHFRIDRIQQMQVLEAEYPLETGKTLTDYLQKENARLPGV
ncbi:helix-turn-helix transcriptional regulator [Leeia oryzae]|uniref:helix-turn-helix transcriptional regulator n=1 Tax=Leeia oryzae TaxID=356662 RepID=UPI0003821CB3|nr:YafY family protein [Leeia oryzae]